MWSFFHSACCPVDYYSAVAVRIEISKELSLVGTLSGYGDSMIKEPDEQLVHTSEQIMLEYLFVAFERV